MPGKMSADDRQVLRDYAKTLQLDGSPAAKRELERLNKKYANYGMSFGTLKGV